ncbi:hypothetical protein GCM10009122_58670 [Fulvivirga kasyanovii]
MGNVQPVPWIKEIPDIFIKGGNEITFRVRKFGNDEVGFRQLCRFRNCYPKKNPVIPNFRSATEKIFGIPNLEALPELILRNLYDTAFLGIAAGNLLNISLFSN